MLRLFALFTLFGCATSLRVEIVANDETLLSVEVDLAESEEARRRGLRDHTSLSPDQGLLLVFPGPSEVCISNVGVAFAIDAIFVEDHEVRAVESFGANDPTLHCHRADEVLEVFAGVASRVEVGDDFRWE